MGPLPFWIERHEIKDLHSEDRSQFITSIAHCAPENSLGNGGRGRDVDTQALLRIHIGNHEGEVQFLPVVFVVAAIIAAIAASTTAVACVAVTIRVITAGA
jgi:hypothetical protein